MKPIELIDKLVVSLYECKNCGYITKLHFNSQLKCLYFSTLFNNLSYTISTKDICTIADCITVKNRSNIYLSNSMDLELYKLYNPHNLDVYNTDGKLLGKVSRIILDSKNYLDKIILDNDITIHKSNIFNISNDLILVQSDTKKSKSTYRPKKISQPTTKYENVVVTILDTPNNQPLTTISKSSTNTSLISDTSMLLNRYTTDNLVAINGEIIVRKNTKITKEIIKKAHTFGKIYELIKYSK